MEGLRTIGQFVYTAHDVNLVWHQVIIIEGVPLFRKELLTEGVDVFGWPAHSPFRCAATKDLQSKPPNNSALQQCGPAPRLAKNFIRLRDVLPVIVCCAFESTRTPS